MIQNKQKIIKIGNDIFFLFSKHHIRSVRQFSTDINGITMAEVAVILGVVIGTNYDEPVTCKLNNLQKPP